MQREKILMLLSYFKYTYCRIHKDYFDNGFRLIFCLQEFSIVNLLPSNSATLKNVLFLKKIWKCWLKILSAWGECIKVKQYHFDCKRIIRQFSFFHIKHQNCQRQNITYSNKELFDKPYLKGIFDDVYFF